MSRIPIARPIPVGLLDPGPETELPPTKTKPFQSWLQSATIATAFGAFALASAGLTAAGFRPVSQNVTETDHQTIAEPVSGLTYFPPTEPANLEESLEYIEPGEARPSLANPKTSSSDSTPVE